MTLQAGREVFLGVDVGTQGARVVALDGDGRLLAERHRVFDSQGEGTAREQSASIWWETVRPLLGGVAGDIAGQPGLRPVAVGVTSTSGTVVPLDDRHEPVHPALMYGDDRSGEEAALCNRAAAAAGVEATFGTSFGLPKIVWFRRHRPAESERTASWCHAADFLVGRLSGVWGVTDPTSALKTGYDPVAGRWPDFLFDELSLPRDWLPTVAPSGTPLGPISPAVARDTGLPPGVVVTNGMTDGCASQIAA
ncbi:MAG: carbohydrate kinase, FGGY family, partial [uncultured Thermomicrobiales bacterium]